MDDGLLKLAQKVKAKYPEYQDLDDITLAKKVIDKYPEYSDFANTPKVKSRGDASLARVIDDEFSKLGYNPNARLSILGDVGRENAWNRNIVFKGHSDPKNKVSNRGIISWQKDRRQNLDNYLKKQGVLGKNNDDEIRGMVRFMDEEMRTRYPKAYQKLRNAQNTYDASEALRDYIRYVPDAPYNTYDPEFRVKNNADWAKEARKLGLGTSQPSQGVENIAPQFSPLDPIEVTPYQQEALKPVDTSVWDSLRQDILPQEQLPQAQVEAPVQVDNADYSEFLKQTGLLDTPETRAEYNIVQQASVSGANAENEKDIGAYNEEVKAYNAKQPVQKAAQKPRTTTPQVQREVIEQPKQNKDSSISFFYETGKDYKQQEEDAVVRELSNELNVSPDTVKAHGAKYGWFGPYEPDSEREAQAKNRIRQTRKIPAYVKNEIVAMDKEIKRREDYVKTSLAEREKYIDPTLDAADRELERFRLEGLLRSEVGLLDADKQTKAYEKLKADTEAWKEDRGFLGIWNQKEWAEVQRFLGGRPDTGNRPASESYQPTGLGEDIKSPKDYFNKAYDEMRKQYGSPSNWVKAQKEYKERFKNSPFTLIAKGGESAIGGVMKAPFKAASSALKSIAIASEGIDKAIGGDQTEASKRYLYILAQGIEDIAKGIKVDKDFEGGTAETIGDIVGQVIIQTGLGIATGGAGAPATLGAMQGGAQAYEQGTVEGLSGWTRLGKALGGALIEAPDYFIFKGMLKGANVLNDIKAVQRLTATIEKGLIGKGIAKPIAEKMATATADGFVAELIAKGGFKGTLGKGLKIAGEKAKVGGAEMLQEGTTRPLNEAWAFITYDRSPERWEKATTLQGSDFVEGVGGFFGGIVGASMGDIASRAEGLTPEAVDDAEVFLEQNKDIFPEKTFNDAKTVLANRKKRTVTLKPIDTKNEQTDVQKSQPQVESQPLAEDSVAKDEALAKQLSPDLDVNDKGEVTHKGETGEQMEERRRFERTTKDITAQQVQNLADDKGVDISTITDKPLAEMDAEGLREVTRAIESAPRSILLEDYDEAVEGQGFRKKTSNQPDAPTVTETVTEPPIKKIEPVSGDAVQGSGFRRRQVKSVVPEVDTPTVTETVTETEEPNIEIKEADDVDTLKEQKAEAIKGLQEKVAELQAQGQIIEARNLNATIIPVSKEWNKKIANAQKTVVTGTTASKESPSKPVQVSNKENANRPISDVSKIKSTRTDGTDLKAGDNVKRIVEYKGEKITRRGRVENVRGELKVVENGTQAVHPLEGWTKKDAPLAMTADTFVAKFNKELNRLQRNRRQALNKWIQSSSPADYEVYEQAQQAEDDFEAQKKERQYDKPSRLWWVDVVNPIGTPLEQKGYSKASNISSVRSFQSKNGDTYYVRQNLNLQTENVFEAFNEKFEKIGTAVFDKTGDIISGYAHRQSINVNEKYRRQGVATALTDFAEEKLNATYRPNQHNALSEEMDGFVQARKNKPLAMAVNQPFYSRVESIVKTQMPNKATSAQVTALLAKNSVKELDPEFQAVKVWLEGKDSVSKAEVIEFVEANKNVVGEVVKSNLLKVPDQATPQMEKVMNLDTEVAFTGTTFRVEDGVIMPSSLKGLGAFAQTIEQATGEKIAPFYGMFVTEDVPQMLKELRKLKQDPDYSAASKKGIQSLITAINQSAKLAGAKKAIMFAVIPDAKAHEQSHNARFQTMITDSILKSQSEEWVDKTVKSPLFKKSNIGQRYSGAATQAIEFIDAINAGNFEEIGLDPVEDASAIVDAVQDWTQDFIDTNQIDGKIDWSYYEKLTKVNKTLIEFIREGKQGTEATKDTSKQSAERTETEANSADTRTDPQDGVKKERKTVKTAHEFGLINKNNASETTRYYIEQQTDPIERAAQQYVEEVGFNQAFAQAILAPTEVNDIVHLSRQMAVIQLLDQQAQAARNAGDMSAYNAYEEQSQAVMRALAPEATEAGRFIQYLSKWKITNPATILARVKLNRVQNGMEAKIPAEVEQELTETAKKLQEAQAIIDGYEAKMRETESKESYEIKGRKTKPLTPTEKKVVDRYAKASAEALARLQNRPMAMAAYNPKQPVTSLSEQVEADIVTIGVDKLLRGWRQEPMTREEFDRQMAREIGAAYTDNANALHTKIVATMDASIAEQRWLDKFASVKSERGNENKSDAEIEAIIANRQNEQKAKAKVRSEHRSAVRKHVSSLKQEEASQEKFEAYQKKVEELYPDITAEQMRAVMMRYSGLTGTTALVKGLRADYPSQFASDATTTATDRRTKLRELNQTIATAEKIFRATNQAMAQERVLVRDNKLTPEQRQELAQAKKDRSEGQKELTNLVRETETPKAGVLRAFSQVNRAAKTALAQTAVNNLFSAKAEQTYLNKPVDTMDILLQRVFKGLKDEGLTKDASIATAWWTPNIKKSEIDEGVTDWIKGLSKHEILLRVIDEHPDFYAKFFGDISPDLHRGVSKTLDKLMIPMRVQEFFMRDSEGVKALAQRAAMKGLDFQEILRNSDYQAFDKSDIEFALNRALSLTYALRPQHGEGVTASVFTGIASALRYSGIVDMVASEEAPFLNFIYNTINKYKTKMPLMAQARLGFKTIYEIKRLQRAGEEPHYIKEAFRNKWTSRQIADQMWGVIAFGVLLSAVRGLGDADEWYLFKVPFTQGLGRDGGSLYFDIRTQPMLAPIAFLANKFNRIINGKDAFTYDEGVSSLAEPFLGLSYRNNIEGNALNQAALNTAYGMLNDIKGGDDPEKNWDKAMFHLQKWGGNFVGTYTNFLQFKTMKDIASQIDTEEQNQLRLTDRPFLQGIDSRLPESKRILKDLIQFQVETDRNFATGKTESRNQYPILKVLGLNLRDEADVRKEPSQATILANKLAFSKPYERPVLPKDVLAQDIKRDFRKAGEKATVGTQEARDLTAKLKTYSEELRPGQIKYATKGLFSSDLEDNFKSLTFEEGERVYKVATPAEQETIKDEFKTKLRNASNSADKSQAEKQKARELLKKYGW